MRPRNSHLAPSNYFSYTSSTRQHTKQAQNRKGILLIFDFPLIQRFLIFTRRRYQPSSLQSSPSNVGLLCSFRNTTPGLHFCFFLWEDLSGGIIQPCNLYATCNSSWPRKFHDNDLKLVPSVPSPIYIHKGSSSAAGQDISYSINVHP